MQNIHWAPFCSPPTVQNITTKLRNNTDDYRVNRTPVTVTGFARIPEIA